MNSSQIKEQLESMKRQYDAGNIGWSNYKTMINRIFGLLLNLVENVIELERKKENLNG